MFRPLRYENLPTETASLDAIVTNGNVECFIDGKPSSHEGFE